MTINKLNKHSKIGVDFDDVLFSLVQSYINWHNNHYGTKVSYKDVTDWYLSNFFGTDPEVTVIRLRHFMRHHHSKMKPYEGVSDLLRNVKENGSKLYCISARPTELYRLTEQMLQTYYSGLFTDLIVTNAFSDQEVCKSDVCAQLGITAMVDDFCKNPDKFEQQGITFLMPDRPWNKSMTHNHVTRCHSFHDVYERLIK